MNQLRPSLNYEAMKKQELILKPGQSYLKLESPGYMPLTVEKIGKNIYSICHYGKQNGDLMKDPDMELEINESLQTVNALSFQNDYLGVYQPVYRYDENGKVKSKNEKLQNDLNKFLSMWLKNIKAQGFKVLTESNDRMEVK